MEVIASPTGTGFVATDSTTYATLALLKAAGKTAFPGLEVQGLYPASLLLTSRNAADTATGGAFQFAINAQSVPSAGVENQGTGQQFTVRGVERGVGSRMIQSVCILAKDTAGDIIRCAALYEG